MSRNVKRRFRVRLILEGVGVGIAAGLSVGAFRYLLAVSGAFRQGLCEAVSIAAAQGRWLWPILYMSAFFIIAWLLAKIVAQGFAVILVLGHLQYSRLSCFYLN